MVNILKILFGEGWYILLYLISYFWYFVFPGMTVWYYMKENWSVAIKGGDTSGGLGLFIIGMFALFVMIPVLMTGSILWVTTFNYSLLLKIVIVLGISVVIPIILVFTCMGMFNKIQFFVYYIGYFSLFVLHLFMLYKFINR